MRKCDMSWDIGQKVEKLWNSMLKAQNKVPKPEKLCKKFRKCAKTWECVKIWERMRKCLKLINSAKGWCRKCAKGWLRKCAKGWESVPKLVRFWAKSWESVPKPVKVWESALKLEKIGESMSVCAKCYC